MKFLFDFSAVRFWYVLGCVVLRCVASPVDTMTDLLSYSGWLALTDREHGLEIIDRQGTGETGHEVLMEDFLVPEVDEENVAEKIRLSHQFLSCWYARELIDLCDLERGLAPQCRRMEPASEAFKYLKEYVQILAYKNPMVLRMIGALSSLHDLSPTEIQFQNRVFEVLVDIRDYYQHKTGVGPAGADDQTTMKIVDEESLKVEKQAHLMSKRLFAFYNRYCSPLTEYVKVKRCSKGTFLVKELEEYNVNRNYTRVFNTIKEQLENMTKRFTDSHDNTSGFEYDPESNTTRIITKDPDTAVRVNKLNILLETEKWWMSLNHQSFRERGGHYWMDVKYILSSDGNSIVTKENVYAKLKKSHLLLSCKYASILKKCCGYTANMWRICQKSQDAVCLDKFLQILIEIDPSVEHMVKALSFFHKLSPDTVYNIGVFDLLTRFKSFYNDRTALPRNDRDVSGLGVFNLLTRFKGLYGDRTALPRNDRDVSSWSPAIVKDLSEITQATDEFYKEFCRPEDLFCTGDNITIDVMGEALKRTVEEETEKYAVFSFRYIYF